MKLNVSIKNLIRFMFYTFMKKIIPFLLFVILSFSCSESNDAPINSNEETQKEPAKIVLDNINRPVLFDFTSTGCPGCESWGKPTFNTIAEDYAGNIVPLAVHIKYGDPMITPISEAIANNRTGAFYTPQLWVNNKNGMILSGNSINSAASVENIRAEIDIKIAETPEMAVGVSGIIDKSTIRVRLKTKNLSELSGEYYKAIYIIENGLNYNQSNSSFNPTIHDFVIREINDQLFGKAIPNNATDKNFENEEILTFELVGSWNPNKLGVSTVIWKKIGATFYVVNAFYKKIEN